MQSELYVDLLAGRLKLMKEVDKSTLRVGT